MTFHDVLIRTTEPERVCQWIAENLSGIDLSVSGWEDPDANETILMRLRVTDERAAVLAKTIWGTGTAGL